MQIIYKTLASFLSVALIFTSVTPSLAQIRPDRRRLEGGLTHVAESTRGDWTTRVERQAVIAQQVREASALTVNQKQADELAQMTLLVHQARSQQVFGQKEENDVPSLDEFAASVKEYFKPQLEKALKKCKTEEERRSVMAQWEDQMDPGALVGDYNKLLAEMGKEKAKAERDTKAYLKQLSEDAVKYSKAVYNYRVKNETNLARSVDPISEFLPLMASLGEEVVSRKLKGKAAIILRNRLAKEKGLCKETDTEACRILLRDAAALAVLGVEQKDAFAVAEVLEENYNSPQAAGVIMTIGPMLLAMDDIDPEYRAYAYVMDKIVRKGDEISYWEIVGAPLSAGAWVEAAHTASAGGIFARGYENSFYKDPKATYKNLDNAWVDFGQQVAEESKTHPKLKRVTDALVNGQLVRLRNGKNGIETGTKHNLFLTGLLAGGYAINYQGMVAHEELDAQGRSSRVADTRGDAAGINRKLREANLTQSEWVAYVLYYTGKSDVEPYTERYLRNQLYGAFKRAERPASGLGMEVKRTASQEDLSTYENWQMAKGIANVVDIALVAVTVVFIGVGVVKAATGSMQMVRTVTRATRLARAARAANIERLSSMGKVLRSAHRYKFAPKMQAIRTQAVANVSKPKFTAVANTAKPQFKLVDMGDGRTVGLAFTAEQEEAFLAQRTNIAPQTFTSQGAPVANTTKVQPTMTQTTAGTTQAASASAATSGTTSSSKVTPKWIWGKSTNSLGQTVPSMVPNPAHPEYAQMLAAQSGKVSRQFSWKNLWTDIQLAWQLNKPNFSQLFKFGTSRYGLAALGPGAAPMTSEAAIARAGNSIEIVQNIRAQQGMFIMEDALRGGSGASYRIGAVNPGGVAAARYAQVALDAVNPVTQAAKVLSLSMGASRTAQAAKPSYASGMAYSLVFPVPSFIMNRLLQARMPAEDGSDEMGGAMPSGQKASNQERKKEEYLAELPVLLQRVESYATLHDGELHPKKWWKEDNATYEKVAAGIKYLKKHGLADHPLVARFSALTETAAQKQAAKKQTKQQKDASQNKELMMLKAYLSKLEEFAREHDNRLPEDNPVAKGYDLRKQVTDRISSLKARKVLENDDPLIQRYERLVEADRLQQYEQAKQTHKQQEKQVRMSDEDGTESVESGNATSAENVTETKKQENDPSSIQKLAQIYQGGNARSPREQRKVDRVVKRLAERLPQLEEFARKYNGRLPSTKATVSSANYTTEEDASLVNSVKRDIEFLEEQGFRDDPLSQRYAALVEGHKNYLVANLSAALDQLEKYARTHNGSLPHKSTFKNYGTEQDLLLREQIVQNINFLRNLISGKSWEKRDHVLAKRCEPLFQRYDRLNQAHQQKLKDERKAVLRAERQAAQEGTKQRKLQQKEDKRREEERQQIQKEWEEEQARLEKQARIEEAAVRRQDKEWNQYEEALADETTADRAARVADSRIAWLGQTTEDFIVQLVNFYNNINPFGNAELNIQFNKPGRWADELEKFIDKNHRAPMRYAGKDITSQEMKDEQRLAKAVYGLSDRLPADNPDKIRIDQLLASIGMSKAEREQKRREQILAFREKGRAARLENLRQAQVAQETTDNEQNLQQAEQEIQNSLQKNTAAQTTSQSWLDAQLDETENEWSEEEDIYNAMRQTSSAQAAGQRRLSQDLDAAEQELLEQEMRAQDEADLNAALAQTSAAQANFQTRLEAELDAAEAELIKEEQQNKSIAKTEQTQTVPEITLSSLEKAISQFIALPMPFFLFEGILQNIFTSTDAKMAALADTHKRGRRPGYASLWLKTAEEEKYDVKNLGLIKLAKDKQSPLLPLFKLREEAQKVPPKQAATAQETAVEQTVPETIAPAQENPVTPGNQLRTGIDGLNFYLPNWRTELATTKEKFSNAQLNAIEAAFITTDEAIFGKDADGNLIYNPSRSKEAWNYSQTFTDILTQSGIPFTPNQYRQIVGGVGARGFTLASIFRLYENMAFMLSQQRKPQKAIYQDSKDLTSQIKAQAKLDTQAGKKNTPAQLQAEEVQLGIRTSALLTSLRKAGQENTPIYQAFISLQDPFNMQKSYEEWFALLKEFTDTYHRWPHQAFSRKEESKIPLEQQIKEKQLATAANRSMSRLKAAGMEGSPIYQAFKQLQEKYRTRKTPEEWIALLEQFTTQYKRWPRAHISENDIIITDQIQRQAKLDTEHGLTNTQAQQIWAEVQLGQAMNALSGQWKKTGKTNTPLYQRFKVLKDRYGATFRQPKSSQELWEEVSEYVTSNKKFPLSRSVIGKTLDSRLRYYQSAMVDGKYSDPWLQKIYELKLAVQAAESGNFRLEKQGENYVVIVIQETTATQTPQKHALVLQVNELTGQILEQVGAQASLQRTHYASWLRKAHDNGYIVGDDATYKVLFTVERMVQNYANLNMAQRTLVNDVLDTLGQYQAFLGRHKGGFFYKIAYKGTEDTLLAQNFYLQAERTGWEWDADSPDKEIEKISEAMGDSGYLASRIEEDPDEEFASQIVFNEDVTSETAEKHLNDLLKVFNDLGYTVRMGTHELGLVQNKDNTFTVSSAFRTGRLHIHLEHAPDPEAEIPVGVNIRFYIDAGVFTGPINRLTRQSLGNLPDDEIAANYFGLFRSSLTQEAKQALAQIVKSSAKAK